jgi:hypothetical protein
MLPSPQELPPAGESFELQQPAAAMPFAAAVPMPVVPKHVESAPAVETPIAIRESAPQQPARRLDLQMPTMMMPSTAEAPAISKQAANPSPVAQAPQASLRLPASVQSPAQPAVLKPQQKSVMKRKPAATGPGISLQMPNSVQGHRRASPDMVSNSSADPIGEPLSLVAPQLQLPNSVLAAPANSEGG